MNILLIAALFPPIFLLVKVYQLDKIEKEPVGLIVRLFIFGALMCIPAAFIEMALESVISSFLQQGSYLFYLIEAFFVVALAEEGVKRFVLKRLTWNNPEFNYQFDGVVYAVASSLGFAALENVLYVVGEAGGLQIAAMRGVMSIPGHCIFGIFMGYYYGMAKKAQSMGDQACRKRAMKNSLLVPILLHGFYDFCLFSGNEFFIAIFIVFIIIMDIVAYRSIKRFAKEDGPL